MSDVAPTSVVLAGLDSSDGDQSERRDDEPLATVARALAGDRCVVIRVTLIASDNDDQNAARIRQAVQSAAEPIVVGGFSLGARLAANVASDPTASTRCCGLLALGYPFHRASKPADRPGLAALLAVEAPVQIIQGTRDRYGSRAFVRQVVLPQHIAVRWLDDGNHRFVPRARHSESHGELLSQAASSAVSFVRSHSRPFAADAT